MTVTQRAFHLGDVISVVFGKLVSPRLMDGVYDTLNFLTRDNLFTHQLPRACRAVRPYVLAQHPALAAVEADLSRCTTENWRAWLDEQVQRYGETLTLSPLPLDAWLCMNPLDEAQMMVGPDRVVKVVTR